MQQILLNGWPVFAECDKCSVRIKADVESIARRLGGSYSLWGSKFRCRCVGCPGRVTFYLHPPGAIMAVAMTAKH